MEVTKQFIKMYKNDKHLLTYKPPKYYRIEGYEEGKVTIQFGDTIKQETFPSIEDIENITYSSIELTKAGRMFKQRYGKDMILQIPIDSHPELKYFIWKVKQTI